ncbi:MAG: hypothetical protein J7619_03940 [Dyadobacter sp.]|uniref:hypothetical protein n=1 Tax=Dyadobacter sp. TaxID=1914288 RepID=UPI001B12EFCB|nr:hypothetical protein [Dyadobacter sp.]MBO9611818.1 hypothetical protein [Dyadobacter sp.]
MLLKGFPPSPALREYIENIGIVHLIFSTNESIPVKAYTPKTGDSIEFFLRDPEYVQYPGDITKAKRPEAFLHCQHTFAINRYVGRVIHSHENEVQLPYPKQALPTVTFTDKLSFHEGNETIELLYFKNAHTDGDAVVHFKEADIYHTGDIFVTYGLPIIDADSGGNIFDLIEAVDTLLARADDRTRFIPGHGPLCSKKELLAYKHLLTSIKDKVVSLYMQNKPLAEIIKETRTLVDPNLSGVNQRKFIEQVYRMVKSHSA